MGGKYFKLYGRRVSDKQSKVDNNDSINSELTQLRYILSELVRLFNWSDNSALHAALHIRNAVLNARADLSVANYKLERLEEENKILRQEISTLKVNNSKN
jgi:cell division protein FtsB